MNPDLIVVVALFFLAVIFSEINRPKPASPHGYGLREWGVITLLSWGGMVLIFRVVVSLVQ